MYKGSVGKAEAGRGFQGHSFFRLREGLLQQGKIALCDGVLVFNEDVLFTSPSGASAVVCGTTCNGWLDWKNADGATLQDLKRKTVASATYGVPVESSPSTAMRGHHRPLRDL